MEERQLHVPNALPPDKEQLYPFDKRLDGPQTRFVFLKKKNKFLQPGTEISFAWLSSPQYLKN
jgi:hypothetical protein